MPPISNTLARASFESSAPAMPRPVLAFAEHRAAVTQIVVVDHERVLSVDQTRIAIVWNPQTGAVIARHRLDDRAFLDSAFAMRPSGTLAYVALDGESLVVRALADHAVVARVSTTGLGNITFAQATADLTRIVVAGDEDLVLLSLADGARLARVEVATHEPQILDIRRTPEDKYFVVGYHHIAGDMIPMDADGIFDSTTLEKHHAGEPRWFLDPFPQGSPLRLARVHPIGPVARIVLDNGRPLPDLAAHEREIRTVAWLVADVALLTADAGGTILRWNIDVSPAEVPAQHAGAITAVRFAGDAIVSFTEADTKLWRDDTLVAELPGLRAPRIDEHQLTDLDLTTVRTYSLRDGALVATLGAGPGHKTVGARGRISVGLADAFPTRVIALPARTERTLPLADANILSSTAPPIVHGGRLLVTYYQTGSRSLSLDTLAVAASRALHENGTCWTALHPDGVTLYSAGYSDGRVAASDAFTLRERDHWRAFEGSKTALLLPEREEVVVAGRDRVRRVALGVAPGLLAKVLGAPECAVTFSIEELVADAAERRLVAFAEHGAAHVLDVEAMRWVEPHAGEIEAARTRRRTPVPPADAPDFDHAWLCGRWLVGWSRGLGVTPVAFDGRTLREPFAERAVGNYDAVRSVLVDDTHAVLWVLRKTGELVRISLADEAPAAVVATIAGANRLAHVSAAMLAVETERGAVQYLRATGEPVCTLSPFASSLKEPRAFAETFALCAHPQDGSLRVAAIASGAYSTLQDPCATAPATAIALAPPFVASKHGNRVVRWDLRTNACTGAWESPTSLTAIAVRTDGAVLAGEASGKVTMVA